jgi:hypothetical protein
MITGQPTPARGVRRDIGTTLGGAEDSPGPSYRVNVFANTAPPTCAPFVGRPWYVSSPVSFYFFVLNFLLEKLDLKKLNFKIFICNNFKMFIHKNSSTLKIVQTEIMFNFENCSNLRNVQI